MRAYPMIHVAGTNGKGSVCLKLAHALRARGLRVGLYTSPHISSFRERIMINDDAISEQSVVDIGAYLHDENQSIEFAITIIESYD
jgi:dihydrofolate synthase/folylpolyglutamate synthase